MTEETTLDALRLNVKLERITVAINKAWIDRYGGCAVDEASALESRIRLLASDRDCWLANAKANQKEYLRLDALMRSNVKVRGRPLLGDPS